MSAKMIHNGVELELLSDDGNGHRLWKDPNSDKVANENYDVDSGESDGLDGDIEGWNYTQEDSLI